MSRSYQDLVRAVADATEPDPASVARVRERLAPRLHPATELLSGLGEPSALQLQRVRARVGRRPERSAARWLVPVGLTVAAAAAAALAVVPSLEGAGPAPVDLALTDAPVAVSEQVRLAPAGEGRVQGADRTFAVAWQRGEIGVDVTPNAGVDLTVTTPEATVRVVGTVFDVRRDRLGTTVTVERGRVAVDCVVGEDPPTLGAGERHTCWPTTAAGLLGRTHALQEQGRGAAEVLGAVELGLAQPDATGLVEAELLAASLAPLVEAGRHDQALEHAERYLAAGGSRLEVRRYAALLALSLGDCARAVPHLLALPAPTPEEQAALARCE